MCWCSHLLLVTAGDASHLVRHREMSRLFKKYPNIKTMCQLASWAPEGVQDLLHWFQWEKYHPAGWGFAESSVACPHTQAEFQRRWRSKEKASDKATAQSTRHVNNLETAKSKKSQMQALKASMGYLPWVHPKAGDRHQCRAKGSHCLASPAGSQREVADYPPSLEGLEAWHVQTCLSLAMKTSVFPGCECRAFGKLWVHRWWPAAPHSVHEWPEPEYAECTSCTNFNPDG